MKNKKNIGLFAAAALVGLSVMACSWYSAEPPPFVALPTPEEYFEVNAHDVGMWIVGEWTIFPSGTVITGLSALGENAGLTELNIPPTINRTAITAIGSSAFAGESNANRGPLATVIIPDGVQAIFETAFMNNSLTEVTIPDGVQAIGHSAFMNNFLTEVTIPGSVQGITDNAFMNNSLAEVIISASVQNIGAWAFADNPELAKVTFMINPTVIHVSTFTPNGGNIVDGLQNVTTPPPFVFVRVGQGWVLED
ncbi:MAG: leucine-rich repeat protein [Spirochaetes bacterium]|nr:leucine-rich repeat protein [Spirochaetota bacterium]